MNEEISTEAAQFPGKEYKMDFPCSVCHDLVISVFSSQRQTWTLHIPAQEEYKKCDFPTLNK